MYPARMLKTLPMCNLMLRHSTWLCWNKKPVKNFPIQVSQNYCSVSASGNKLSTMEEPELVSADTLSLDSLIDMMKSKIRLQHGPRYDYDFHDIKEVLLYLVKYRDVKRSQILRLFINQPSLCQHFFKSWEDTVVTMRGNGLQVSNILTMLEICPQLLKMSPENIDQAFVCLREQNFSGKNLVKLVTEAPELICKGADFIFRKISHLMTLFTKNDIQVLAMNQPHALLESFEDTKSKVRYILHEINLGQREIVHSKALSHSLEHICLRHQIMVRTGKFRKPHPKKKISNPSLTAMLGSSIKDFSENICEISVEEYEVFGRMLEREKSKQRTVSSDSENDSDNDSDSEAKE